MVGAHAPLSTDAELQGASWAATRGAAVGASKWAVAGGAAALIGQSFSPLYRGLTIQFKVFLQIAFMTFGGVIEADRYMRHHGQMMRSRKQMLRDAEVWRRYEEEYGGGKSEKDH